MCTVVLAWGSWVSNTVIKAETRMAVIEQVIQKDLPELKERLDMLLEQQGLRYVPKRKSN